MRKIMITGGFGFIGSNLVRYWLDKYPDDFIINVDAKTYAARPEFLLNYIEEHEMQSRIVHEQINIRDQNAVARLIRLYEPDHVLHLAAESHVCRSIAGPSEFIHTNIVGTFNLLEEFKGSNKGKTGRFVYVSTDEVFGELEPNEPAFNESLPLLPRSPYAASKAAGDLLAMAYHDTYGLNVSVTNCSNNFGPNQHEEKLLARTIMKFLDREKMTVYGSGEQVRDWLYVEDHCEALDDVLHKGKAGERYCIGGLCEMTNIDFIGCVNAELQELTGLPALGIIKTNDRPTDDLRYAIDVSKIRQELGWQPKRNIFKQRLRETIQWYLKEHKKSGAV